MTSARIRLYYCQLPLRNYFPCILSSWCCLSWRKILYDGGLPWVAFFVTTVSLPRSIYNHWPIWFFCRWPWESEWPFGTLFRQARQSSCAEPQIEEAVMAEFGKTLFSILSVWWPLRSFLQNTQFETSKENLKKALQKFLLKVRKFYQLAINTYLRHT